MDFFDGVDYRFNKFLMSLIGQWPYDDAFRNNAVLLTFIVVAGSQSVTKITGIITIRADTHLFIESLPPIIVDVIAVIKMATCIVKAKQMKALLDQIKYDWESLKAFEEIAILHRYTDNGRRLVQVYTGYMYFAMVTFMIMPFAPTLLHFENESNARPLLHNVNYFVDPDKYYYGFLLHSYVQIVMCITIYIAVDTLFIILISHVCGMFATIGYRLEHITENDEMYVDMYPPIQKDEAYKIVGQSIQMHINALRFVGLMESAFNVTLLLQAGLNMFIMSVTGVQAMTNLDNLHELFRQLTFSCAQLFHLCFESYQAQQLMDHSERVHEHLINSMWYLTSARTKKLISFMVLRSQFPSQLTAGKLFVISMETCSAIIRMSVSYFMMLRAFQ